MPTGRSELRDGGLWIDADLAIALDVWTAQCEALPGLADLALAEQRRVDGIHLDGVVDNQEAKKDTAVARARAEASGVPVWSVVLWVAGAVVVGAGGGVVLGLVAR